MFGLLVLASFLAWVVLAGLEAGDVDLVERNEPALFSDEGVDAPDCEEDWQPDVGGEHSAEVAVLDGFEVLADDDHEDDAQPDDRTERVERRLIRQFGQVVALLDERSAEAQVAPRDACPHGETTQRGDVE